MERKRTAQSFHHQEFPGPSVPPHGHWLGHLRAGKTPAPGLMMMTGFGQALKGDASDRLLLSRPFPEETVATRQLA